MRLAMNMTNMAIGGFLCTAIDEAQHPSKRLCAEVHEEKKGGVEFAGHNKVEAVIERQPAMLRQNYLHGCLHCQNVTA